MKENTKTNAAEVKAAEDDMLCVDTRLGQLVAYRASDPAYPGIYIDIKREGSECMAPVALVEYDSDSYDDAWNPIPPAMIVCRVWGDSMNEDYTFRRTCANLDTFFGEGYGGAGITDSMGDDRKLSVSTELGEIIAYRGGDPDYPGIYVDIKRDGTEAPAMLVEYTATEQAQDGTLPPSIICRVWGDAVQDDYTDTIAIRNLDAYFAQGE